MSATDTEDLPVQDELAALKARADMLGVTYHPSIGVEKLREKVNAALASDTAQDKEDPEPKQDGVLPGEESPAARRIRKKREATELVRIRVTCMNPAKREWDGEIFTAGNSLVGSHSKFVPFNADDGWHVPRIIYNQIIDRKCQIFVTTKSKNGVAVRQGKLIKEFAVEVLPPLTKAELDELARRQAMAQAID